MTQSMTGFARCQADGLTWEIRSVNQRYLETSFKIPDVFRALESSLRQRLRRRLHRGKIDCLLRFDGDHITSTKINEENLRELRRLMEAVHRVVPDASRPSALDIVRWPGVLDQTPVDEARLFEKANGLFDEALTGLIEMRRREGHELNQAITVLISNLAKEVTHISTNVHTVSQYQSERLRIDWPKPQSKPIPVDLSRSLFRCRRVISGKNWIASTHILRKSVPRLAAPNLLAGVWIF